MAPSAAEITALCEEPFSSKMKQGTDLGPLIQFGNLDQLFADDIAFEMAGYEFHLASKVQGIDALKGYLSSPSMPSLASIIDVSKPIQGKLVRVIGGGDSEWAAAILRSTATTVKNKPWNHEMVLTMRFNNEGKICELKGYADTLHIHNHVSESLK